MFPPASLLPSQEELMVDELLDLRGMPEPENKLEEKEEETKEPSFIPFEKNESLPLSEISLPEENEATNLEWLSRFVHDCNSPEPPASPPVTAAPASNSTVLIPIKSKRSKRRRTKASLWSHEPYFSSIPKKQGRKQGRKQKNPFAGNRGDGERQCTHCGVKRTPQWRAGPCGPKTLCNACGVRYKSGRLLPEYRPACSPTFISKVHSNSHREVLEMRRKKDEQLSQPQLRRFILAEPTMFDLK